MEKPTILITGASSGIGRASVETMLDRGWNVFAGVRNPDDIPIFDGTDAQALHIDYADETSLINAANSVLKATNGRIDVLFNNGAYAQPGALEDITPALMREQFEANFLGWHALTQLLLPAMRQQGFGRIIQCSSILGLVGMKFRGPYVASKFALEGYSDVLRMELAPSGIHVSLIIPGPIRTKFVENAAARFRDHIDHENSAFRELYKRRLAKLDGGGTDLFKLEPEAVVRKLLHAAESRKPKARYYVTKPAWFLNFVRRMLPTRTLDRLLTSYAED